MENTQKIPPRYKGKSVYFNLDNPDDLLLHEHAMNICITNQSSGNEGDIIDN